MSHLQIKYVFPQYNKALESEISNLENIPMFFVTDSQGVNYLINNSYMNYYIIEKHSNKYESWHLIRFYKDTGVFKYMFNDLIEPEDNSLVRDWLFLCPLLEEIYEEGMNHKYDK